MIKENQGPILIGLALAGGFIGYKKYKSWAEKQKTKKGVTSYNNATVSTPSGSINLVETARQLGLDLGTAYGSWDPRSWSENDDAIEATLKKIPKNLFAQIALEYFKLYNRDLRADVQKNLDTDNYKRIQYLFT